MICNLEALVSSSWRLLHQLKHIYLLLGITHDLIKHMLFQYIGGVDFDAIHLYGTSSSLLSSRATINANLCTALLMTMSVAPLYFDKGSPGL